MLIAQTGGLYSVVRLITVFLLFVFVLGITYVTSRYVAGFQKKRMGSSNIDVLESARVMPNTVLEIIRAGDKYLLIAIAKDKVTMLTELDPDSLQFREGSVDSFASIMEKATAHLSDKRRSDLTKNEDGTDGEGKE